MSCSPKAEVAEPKVYDVFILAGQSNMDGLGLVSDLPDSMRMVQPDVWIYNPNRRNDLDSIEDAGYWEELRAGHGSGFGFDSTGSKYSDKFGIELTFARRMRELRPDMNIALYKYAKGGASIHPDAASAWGSWTPDFHIGNGINQWDHFRHHYHRAMAVRDIDGDGVDDVLRPAAILWLQGESDASYTDSIALAYLANLRQLMGAMRAEAGNPELPVVVAQISESYRGEGEGGRLLPWGETVQAAQREFAETDSHAAVIFPPEGHGWLDPWHYDSPTYLELGRRFADATNRLLPNRRP